jgi:hypothetical protein
LEQEANRLNTTRLVWNIYTYLSYAGF